MSENDKFNAEDAFEQIDHNGHGYLLISDFTSFFSYLKKNIKNEQNLLFFLKVPIICLFLKGNAIIFLIFIVMRLEKEWNLESNYRFYSNEIIINFLAF